ncbi:MAG: hypothetical protein JWR67_3687 [Mucilaginibacter sp.]|nr:hypothetical protein [Mucilaginibacter sp.]
MITLKKLKVFHKYRGDVDMWARSNRKSEEIITDTDWHLIDSFLQDFKLINNNSVSSEYVVNFNRRLLENFDTDETIKFLKTLLN